MKKVLVIFVFGVVLFGGCSAQRVDAQNANIAQKIIGIWIDQSETTWVFNANETFTVSGSDRGKFKVVDTKLVTSWIAYNGQNDQWGITYHFTYDILISSDGKTSFLYILGMNSINNGIWLTKK